MGEGTPQFGGASHSTTHASYHWSIKQVPSPKDIVTELDKYVIGQADAKKVGWRDGRGVGKGATDMRCC